MSKDKLTYSKMLWKEDSEAVASLFKIYKENPYNARVVFFNNSPHQYIEKRLMVFEDCKERGGNFQIVLFQKKYGISITNRIYNSEKRILTITYNKKKRQFWLIVNTDRHKMIRPLTIEQLLRSVETSFSCRILDYLELRFSWTRFMKEHGVLYNVSFNTIIKKKLYSLKKALQHQYKVPYPVATILHKLRNSNRDYMVRNLKYYLKYLKNIENLNEGWIANPNQADIFYDTLKMAKTLDRQVNCSWSFRRLIEEHDKWAEEITDIVFTHDNREMTIHKIFKEFAEFSNYKLLTQTKEMALEGRKLNHCVGTYVGKVDSGNSGIYHIDGYTLELTRANKMSTPNNPQFKLLIGQFRGYANESVPEYLYNEAKEVVKSFNLQNGHDDKPLKELEEIDARFPF